MGMLIAADMRPYSIVENKGFKNIVKVHEPRYEIPSHTHFSKKIVPDLYEQEKIKIVEELSKASSVALTTDGWTSRATESYMTDCSLHHSRVEDAKLVLQTCPIFESHTGTNLGQLLIGYVNLSEPDGPPPWEDQKGGFLFPPKHNSIRPSKKCYSYAADMMSQQDGTPLMTC